MAKRGRPIGWRKQDKFVHRGFRITKEQDEFLKNFQRGDASKFVRMVLDGTIMVFKSLENK